MNTEPKSSRSFWGGCALGILAALILAVLVGLPAVYLSYRNGRARGAAGEDVRQAWRRREIPVSVPATPIPAASKAPAEAAAPAADAATDAAAHDGLWRFGPMDCARATWPMEIVAKSADVPRPHLRIRQGANRFATPGRGVAEFVFSVPATAGYSVFVHCRYLDDCGNSLLCRIDGGEPVSLGNQKVFGQWLWAGAHRTFSVGPGLHRLTIQTWEDGVEFDSVVLRPAARPKSDSLDALAFTSPPSFESLPPACDTLPRLEAVTAQAFPAGSLVIGTGHSNALAVYVRLNGSTPAAGAVRVAADRARFQSAQTFDLSPKERSRILTWDLPLGGARDSLVPVTVEVRAGGELVHSQRLNFVKPLSWAFLGPIPDPQRQGLDLPFAAESSIGRWQSLPKIPGYPWKIVEDGSCYDDLGLVDLNKVFGRPNRDFIEDRGDGTEPAVAYAVTCIRSNFPDPHNCLAFGGDDALRMWLNGRPFLRLDNNAPLETTHLNVGTQLQAGRNVFVFKVPQTQHYWQILFEPDVSLPYGAQDRLRPLPADAWPSE